jgi:His/Glu/Gln/Arg/opine family amino acid ABC transporter permease subunit
MFSLEAMWKIATSKMPLFLKGTGLTLELAAWTLVLGSVLGIVVALMRLGRWRVLRWVSAVYVEFLRGTPLLVQVLIVYFGLPQLGLKMPRMTAGIVALTINSAAYMSEIVRSGIQAVDRGQTEAARSLGMNGAQTMLYVVLPQAIRNILPAIGNEFVVIIKESSILYTIGIYELTYQANKLASTNYRYLETLIISAFIYFILTFATSRLLGLLERRMRRGD